MQLKTTHTNFALIIFGTCLSLILGAWVVSAQQNDAARQPVAAAQGDEAALRQALMKSRAESSRRFQGRSSTAIEAHEGNKIVAVNLVDEIQEKLVGMPRRLVEERRTRYVEIELYSSLPIPISALSDIIQIGDREFGVAGRNGSRQSPIVRLTPADYENLLDNALITYRIGTRDNPDALKEYYKKGEPKEVDGAKFGRLKKKSIYELPLIERRIR